jgi:hypothetical protein
VLRYGEDGDAGTPSRRRGRRTPSTADEHPELEPETIPGIAEAAGDARRRQARAAAVSMAAGSAPPCGGRRRATNCARLRGGRPELSQQ